MATRKKKSVKDLAKRRHVRSSKWRVPTGDADVAALAVSVLEATRLRMAVQHMRDAEAKVNPESERLPVLDEQVALAQSSLDDAEAAVEAASEEVSFREIPAWVVRRERLHVAKDSPEWLLWARLAAAEWTDSRGETHTACDLDGDLDDWAAIIEPLPPADFDALATALSACMGR